MERARLKDSIEALIIDAQEQGLSTRYIDPRFRLCKEASRTVQDMVTGCKMQLGTAYIEQYNQEAGIVYMNICTVYDLVPNQVQV